MQGAPLVVKQEALSLPQQASQSYLRVSKIGIVQSFNHFQLGVLTGAALAHSIT